MQNRFCATGRDVCPHKPQCIWDCKNTIPESRKIKPYPHVPAAPIEEEVEKWSSLDDRLAWASWAFVVVVLLGVMLGVAYVIGQLI